MRAPRRPGRLRSAEARPSRTSGGPGRFSAVRARLRQVSSMLPVVGSVIAIVLTLTAILVMNVQISEDQYALVELRSQQRDLIETNESLTQDLEFYQAPQNLALRAQELGLVQAGTDGVVDLNRGAVEGDPQPAAEQQDAQVLVERPKLNGSSAADKAKELARQRRDALPDTEEKAQKQLERAREAEQDVDLHGGSLPAPQQRRPADERNRASITPQPSPSPSADPQDSGAPAPQPSPEGEQ